MNKRKILKRLIIAAVCVVCAVVVFEIVVRVMMDSEMRSRDDWNVQVGEHQYTSEERAVSVYDASVESTISVSRIVPDEYEEDGFTYYDEDVQQRLGQQLMEMVGQGASMDAPLAILDPFGTGSNGLLLSFQTERRSQIRYTVHTTSAELPDYTAVAQSSADGNSFSRNHCFLLIGLVPGETNEVTLEALGERGRVQQTVTFTIDMPEAVSGYANQLDTTDGDSTAALTDGLYYAMGLGDYYGYTFFFDNDGVLRYEMVLEGFHSDRFLYTDGGLYTCVSSRKIALMSPLGQAVRVYDLGQYELHHDINWGPDGTILALVNDTEQDTVMDVVISLDPATGEVSEVVDFSELMDGYYGEMTHPVPITGGSFWQAGEDDWLHLNSVQYMEKDDSILVSSRETSTIIKVSDIGGTPTLSAFIGDPAFWADTPYADLCYAMDGDFVAQYGQHDVELVADDSLEDGQYLLRMYDNNYWSLSTRDGYDPELADSVSTSLTSGDASYITFYLVDDNAKTFSLVEQHAVPYSAIVSNAQEIGGNFVVNSGVAHQFGEYDSDGNLIRAFDYDCMMNGYRVMKGDFVGYWFQETDA
ncbi:MAG TPA: aryl-sulfate sulfotransferase [Candidatus Flavonifractor avistercoris]|nr:aryl-sulfate sulfotransferase [Candidatus Flavonifractor avistercoris]